MLYASTKLCLRCERFPAKQGCKYCVNCEAKVKREMRESGYLTEDKDYKEKLRLRKYEEA